MPRRMFDRFSIVHTTIRFLKSCIKLYFSGPNTPPSNVQGQNTSSTSILVQWDDVSAADRNGIILSYTIIYKALPGGSIQSKVVNAPTRQSILTGLNEYTNYSITVFASTSKGGGNVSASIIVVTDEDSKFSFNFLLQTFIALYINQNMPKRAFNQVCIVQLYVF